MVTSTVVDAEGRSFVRAVRCRAGRIQQLHGRHSNDVGQTPVGTVLVRDLVHHRSDHHLGRIRLCDRSLPSHAVLLRKVVFITSIVMFRTPTAGDYVYPGYANALGWLMVCLSLIFIPVGMIYAFVKAWRVTRHAQSQVIMRLSVIIA